MKEPKETEYIVLSERKARCLDGRKTEPEEQFGKSDGYLLREVEAYLTDYRASARMLEMNRYERDYFNGEERAVPDLSRETEIYLKAKMYDIRAFVLSIGDCDEKLLLYYHYIHGENLVRCAELLAVSRATAYRLKKRALHAAAEHYKEKLRRAQ